MRLTLRLQKLLLSIAALAALAASAALVAWGVSMPEIAPAIASKPEVAVQAPSDGSGGHALPAKQDFAKLWSLPLRRALYDPPPPKPEIKQLPPLRVELLGTIIEPDNSMAILRSEQGSVEYKRIGYSVGPPDSPARLVEIQGEAIVLERAEERVTLEVRARSLR